METTTLFMIGLTALAFFAAGIYLHLLRHRSEEASPLPFVNPHGKRPGKRTRL
jgi:hypothetical protein